MKTSLLCLSALAAAATILPLAAQTAAAPKPAVHTGVATAHHTPLAAHAATCVTLPTLSDKIPALAAGSTCAKPLYTVTSTPTSHLDYVSPLVSPEVREGLGSGPVTFTLAFVDTLAGTGDLVKPGKTLKVKYTGWLTDGTKFDSSDDHPGKDPIEFPYGQHRVIPGWDTGFEGMHVGGKRRIFIPYELAYGDAGKPPVIPAKSELVFDIEVVSQSDAAAAAAAGPPQGARPPRPTPPPAQPAPDAAKPATAPAAPVKSPDAPATTTTTPPADKH